MEKKNFAFSISGVKDRVILYSIIVLLGGGSFANIVIPGRSGNYINAEITRLEERIANCRANFDDFHREWELHKESQAETIATLKAKGEANNYLIRQCMQRTGL